MGHWPTGAVGVLPLPSGRTVRGRALRLGAAGTSGPPTGLSEPTGWPELGVYLLGSPPPPTAWESRWLWWPDFWVPRDEEGARAVLVEAWQRAGDERVEIACRGGRGRTGTALACLAVLDGVPPDRAVAYVRARYHRAAAETWPQRRYVARFGSGPTGPG